MYLKRIELTGFKSFATKTTLDFLPSCSFVEVEPLRCRGSTSTRNCGITAIVGPNGSGKSNVADAIKWAMGEQSLKSIRGKKSEDVIFAGSGKKAQLGSAKVSLFFDNSDKRIPIEFEEVVVARKIFRSGESEYLINNSKVRLIDIADLLAKAGVGQRSYCIINQGMADSVLNASPVERRIIIEEAAGVKSYQLKKERSARKLESTRQNLTRAGDLIKEIEPHLRVLKRQSEKAKKGEDVTRVLKEKQKFFYGSLWHALQKEKDRILSDKEETSREEMKIQRSIDDLEIKVKKESTSGSEFDEKRATLEKKREEIYEELNEIRQKAAMIGAKIEIEKEKAKNIEIIREIPVDFPYFKDEFKKFRNECERLEKELLKIEDLAGLQRIKEEFRNLRKEADRIFREISEGKKPARDGEAQRERENIIDLKAIGELEEKRKAASQETEELNRKIEENRRETNELIKADRETREYFFKLEAELREKQYEIAKVREKLNEVRVEMAKIEVREEDLAKRIREELNLGDPNLVEKPEGSEEPVDMDALEREINRLKIQAEQIGAIDPMIIEEYVETQKRYDFLTSQSEDLEKSMISLAEVIKEMDEKIKEAFEETFKKINHEFSKHFKIIFGGGSAELVKKKIETRRNIRDVSAENAENANEVGEEDEESEKEQSEEVGIEIKACPPGKRITNLSMLSGGERSLTSQALLFAIISNSPPPFAVLDEVEAALDEANSRRFGRILTELSHETQFILITHNRETMRQASILYGVTMDTDGVSKVLSVKLDQVGEKGEIR
ncbi:MAG: AAA family ATPase [Patescibacteria group bacterium]|nr:AAA family ATPase [Patescibacteria group bacterium]